MRLTLFCVLLLAVGGGLVFYGKYHADQVEIAKEEYEEQLIYVKLQNDFLDDFEKAKTKRDFSILASELQLLPDDLKAQMAPKVELGLVTALLADADAIFERARKLQSALTVPPPPPPPTTSLDTSDGYQPTPEPPTPKIHPAAQELADRAIPIYEEIRTRVDKIPEIKGDQKFNYLLHYTKGEIYFRYLQILGTEENSRELFNQTLTEYKLALQCKPGDVNTVVNIELLIKENQSGGGQGGGNRQQKMLNQQAGFGRSTGN